MARLGAGGAASAARDEAPAPQPKLFIYTLGRFRLLRGKDDLRPDTWELHKAAGLFKCLVAEEGRWVPTDVLLERFWPDMDPDRARAALRTTAYALRRALEPQLRPYAPSSFIEASRGYYRFRTDSPHWCDFVELLRLARAAREAAARGRVAEAVQALEQGMGLYQDDFLPEDRYVEWTAFLRERLRQVYLDMAVLAGELAAQVPDRLPALLEHLRAAAARAPEREDVWRALIAALWRSGNVAEALRQYENLCRRLRQDFDVDPTPETRELIRRIRQAGAAGAPARLDGGPGVPLAAAGGASALHVPRPGAPVEAGAGALVLTWPEFCKVVELERRRIQRWGMAASVVLVSNTREGRLDASDWEAAQRLLSEAADRSEGGEAPLPAWAAELASQLRRSDAVCYLGSRRLLMLLPQADAHAARRVAERLMASGAHRNPLHFQVFELPPRS